MLQLVVFWHICTKVWDPMPIWYVGCASYICNVVAIFVQFYVKYVYSATCHIVDGSDFICDICICIHLQYKPMKYLAYKPTLLNMFVSGTDLVRTCEIYICSWFCYGTFM